MTIMVNNHDNNADDKDDWFHCFALASAIVSIVAISISNIVYAAIRDHGANCWIGRYSRSFLCVLSYRQWKGVHALSQVIFLFSTFGLSAIEFTMYLIGQYDRYYPLVPYLDHLVALPSLALATVSGVAMTYARYFRVKNAKLPESIQYMMLLLNLFGLFWVIIEKSVQYFWCPLPGQIPPIWTRGIATIGSCILSYHMRSVMIQFVQERKRKQQQQQRHDQERSNNNNNSVVVEDARPRRRLLYDTLCNLSPFSISVNVNKHDTTTVQQIPARRLRLK